MAKRLNPSLLVAFAFISLALSTFGCSGSRSGFERAVLKDPNTVAVYDTSRLTLDEFERRYVRSVGGMQAAKDDSLGAYQEFLQRYIDFRLKVLAGLQAGYQNDPGIQSEISGYQSTFARPYLLDKEVLNPIIADLYERSKEMVDASHILLRVTPDSSPADTLKAYNKAVAIRDSVLQGADFGMMAVRHSDDPSASRAKAGTPGYRGRLGFFTAGRMVEDFEEMGYNTPVGDVSPVFRTQFGYHMIYVHDRKPALPDIKVSHIMLRPKGTTAADSAKVMEDILAIKQRIESGESFAELAQEFSDDGGSAPRGGDLGFLRFDNYQVDKTFREAAFAMKDLNTVSDVVITPFGYHLITITERNEFGSMDEEYENLKQMAANLPRTKKAEEALTTGLRAQYNAQIDTAAVLRALDGVGLDSLMLVLGGSALPEETLSQPIASLGDSTYTFADLPSFLQREKIPKMRDRDDMLWMVMDKFMDSMALSYEASALEMRDAEFRTIMDEFRDGLILFKLMEDSVWTAASQDSAGVLAHYAANKPKYRFPDRTRVIEIFSADDSLLSATLSQFEEGLTLDQFITDLADNSSPWFVLDTTLVAGQTNSIYDYALPLEPGAHTNIIPHRGGHVILFHGGIEAARPKTFEEARTEVVNDYQKVLEDRLLARLRDRYQVMTYPERLTRAFQESTTMTTTATSSQ